RGSRGLEMCIRDSVKGVQQVAPTAVMIMFAILYFGIMIDAGLFDPMVAKILNIVKGDPLNFFFFFFFFFFFV
ncbi:SLC13 family permease, partial [Bacillus pumilus]